MRVRAFAFTLLSALIAVAALLIAFRIGMYTQQYYDLKAQGFEPYATFENKSSDGKLRSRCDVFLTEDTSNVEYR